MISVRIRGNSERLSVDFGVLAEEKICLEVCEQAEAFMTKMKKVIQVSDGLLFFSFLLILFILPIIVGQGSEKWNVIRTASSVVI